MGDRNQMSIMPGVRRRSADRQPGSRAVAFNHSDEIARPDYYKVTLDGGLVAQMSPTDHAGDHAVHLPVRVDHRQPGCSTTAASPSIRTRRSPAGSTTAAVSPPAAAGCSSGTFDRAPVSTSGPAVTFDTSTTADVTVRLATSFISTDQAHRNLDFEVTGRTLTQVRAATAAAWNDRLGRVALEGANSSQLVSMYSNLYRLNLYPNSQSENTGTAATPRWQYASPVSAPTGTSTPTQTGAKIVDGQIYVNNGFWDTYRTVWPAYSLLYPDVAAKIADGFVQQYRDGGWIARWSSPGYADLMTGTSADVAIGAGVPQRGQAAQRARRLQRHRSRTPRWRPAEQRGRP